MTKSTKYSAKIKKLFTILGPGIVTGASDDDSSGIATHSQAGAQFGLSTLWNEYLQERKIKQVRGKPNRPQTQSKIERYHRSMKNVVRLDNYYYPEELKASLTAFVDYYNNERYHESLDNVTRADVFYWEKGTNNKATGAHQKTYNESKKDS